MAMNYENWLGRLRSVAADLEGRDCKVELEIGPATSEGELAEEEAYFEHKTHTRGFKFDASVRALYKAALSVTFRWKRARSHVAPPMYGAMSLAPLAMLYESETQTDPHEPWYGAWRVLDETSAVTQTVIRFEQDGTSVLGRRSTEGDSVSITPLNLDLDGYFESSLAACCLVEWPLLFATDPSVLTREQVEDFLNLLQEIAPPADPDAVVRARGQR